MVVEDGDDVNLREEPHSRKVAQGLARKRQRVKVFHRNVIQGAVINTEAGTVLFVKKGDGAFFSTNKTGEANGEGLGQTNPFSSCSVSDSLRVFSSSRDIAYKGPSKAVLRFIKGIW